MRRGLETVPRDGKVVILEDDASGTYELAHWSTEERAWVGENGKRSAITPTYWHALQREEYLLPEGDECLLQREFGSSGPSGLRGRHFFPLSSGRAAPERPPGDDIALRQVTTAAVTVPVVEAQTAPSQSEQGPPAWRRFLVSSIAAAMIAASLIGMYFRPQVAAYVTQYAGQRDIARIGTLSGQLSTQVVIQSPTQELQPVDLLARAALQRERERAETLASELTKVRREVEALAALSNKKDDEAAQIKRAAETATSELQQSLQQARERIQTLENELAMAHRNFEAHVTTSHKANDNAGQVNQAEAVTSEFVHPQELRSREKSDEGARLNQAAESATAGLSHSLHQQRDKAEGPASGSKSTKEVTGASSGGQLVSAAGKGSLEAAGLSARAKVLLGRGNIGAARIVLERAVQTGSAEAAFALAETYDPLVLSSWRTYGTRGDATKARELYARAYDGGIKAAKDRSNALHLRRQPAGWFGREEAAIDE